MKTTLKTLSLAALLIFASMAANAQWISNGEGMSIVRAKLNALKVSHDSLASRTDSIVTGLLPISQNTDTITTALKMVTVDSSLTAKFIETSAFSAGASGDSLTVSGAGKLTLHGTAKQWMSVMIEPTVRGDTGANTPTFEQYYGDGGTSRGVYLYSFADNLSTKEDEIFFTLQMPNNWDGDTIYLNVHWVPAVAIGGVGHPKWSVEYIMSEPGVSYGTTTTVTKYDNTAGVTTLSANVPYITEFPLIKTDTKSDGVGTILIGRIYRDSGNVLDTYNGNKCGMLYINAMYRVDGFGSTSRYTR